MTKIFAINRKWDNGYGTGFNVCFSFIDRNSVAVKISEIVNGAVIRHDSYTLRANANTCVDFKMQRVGGNPRGELRFDVDFGDAAAFTQYSQQLGLGGTASNFDFKLSDKLGSSLLNPTESTCGLIGGTDARGVVSETNYISANLNWQNGNLVRIHYIVDRGGNPHIQFSSQADILKKDESKTTNFGDINVPWWACDMTVSH